MKYNFWDDLVIEGTEDYVGLWEIIALLVNIFTNDSDCRVRPADAPST